MNEQYDAIVIGSGVGGLAAGILLANQGKKTLILEKNELIGGRLTSYERDGFKVDLGVHVISRTVKGPYGKLLERVGKKSTIDWVRVRPLSSYNGRVFVFPHDLKEMIPQEDFNALMRFMGDVYSFSEEEVAGFNGITIKEFLDRYTGNNMVHACISNISSIYTCLPSWHLSAGEFMRCLRMESEAKASGYPVGGCAAISDELAEVFQSLGGELRRNAAVDRILIESGGVRGVTVGGKEIESPLVVSNADIQATVLKLAGAQYFDNEYPEYVKGLKYSWYGPVWRVALDKKLTDLKMLTQFGSLDQEGYYRKLLKGEVPPELNMFLVSPSNFSPEVAPEGMQLINFAAPMPTTVPDEVMGEVAEALLDTAEKYVPGLRDHMVWSEFVDRHKLCGIVGEGGVGIGVGQYPDQVGDKRPSVKTPVDGLYIVGGEAGGTGVGIELCINSALECFDEHLSKLA